MKFLMMIGIVIFVYNYIFNSSKNILGMMPHPERLIDPILSGEDGSMIFESLIKTQ